MMTDDRLVRLLTLLLVGREVGKFFTHLRVNISCRRGLGPPIAIATTIATALTYGAVLTLFATGIALAVLLMASYSRRDQWLAGCSMTLSIAAIAGLLFLSTIEDARVRTELVRLVSKLSPVLDQRLLDRVTAAIENFPTQTACGEKERTGCVAAAADPAELPMSNGSDVPRSAEPASDARQDMQAASAAGWFETKKDANEAARSPVAWLLDEAGAPVSSGVAPGFLITGMNVSDETLTRVHGTLKPDSSQREFELALSVQANDVEGEAAIPAGARFSLGFPDTNSPKQGGAIFTFKYTYAGQEKATILYLTPSMIARFANRG